MLTFQRAIASRYFALGKARTWHFLIPAAVFWAIFGVISAFGAVIAHLHAHWAVELYLSIGRFLPLVKLIAGAISGLVTSFTIIAYRLNIFTAISVFGLYLGSAALVVVLSIMSGFEGDLKHKILGTHADVVVTRPDHPFTDYVALREKLTHVPGVVAATPFLLNEVMITSATNESGVIIKGIDPATVGQVTDLAKNTDAGDLNYLEHPEKLRDLGGPPIFHDDDFPGDLHKPAEDDRKKPREHKTKLFEDKAQLPGDAKSVPGAPKPDAKAEPAEPTPEPKTAPKPESKAAAKAGPSDADPDAETAPPKGSVKFIPVNPKDRPRDILPTPPPRRDAPGIIVGRELAKSLRVYLGDDVNIISPFGGIGPSGPMPKSKPYRVAGIFYSGMFEYDNKYTYVALSAAQKFFAMQGEVTGIELKVVDPDRSEDVLPRIKTLVGPDYDVQDWKQINKSLFSALKIEKILMFVLLCFIILVAAFSIIANGTMLVLEKGMEIAVLKAMGASNRGILGAFMLLGCYIGLLGTACGILVGIFSCDQLHRHGLPLDSDVYYITALPVSMHAGEITAVFFAALGIALLATLYPAWMASRLRPVEGLRDSQR